ncbi:MAG: hypothetical protein IH900_07420 [Proteobacteria bacterium]|nr:hypothetical protein [Pseudomonadota bacterium]
MSAAALGAVAVTGAAAQTGAPGPFDLIGYATPEPGAPSKTWSLPADEPYLYVPYVGAEVMGAIATVKIGSDVGAALFQRPFFVSRDVGCAPDLGSTGRPDLPWLGPTARFEPGGAGMPPDAVAAPDPKTGGYASLILFRKDLGPPPGVLLMHRRRTMGWMCGNPTHKLFYKRAFVPAVAVPARSRCVDLVDEIDVGDSKTLTFVFTNSDRIVLLAPSDLSERYRAIRHRFTVTLYDGLECSGKPVTFKSAAGRPGTIKLDDFGFRDKTRSVRLVYEGGPIAAYLEPAAAPEPEKSQPRPAVAEAPKAPVPPAAKPQFPPEPPPEPPSEPGARADEPAVAPEAEIAVQAPEPDPAPGTESRTVIAEPEKSQLRPALEAPAEAEIATAPKRAPEIRWTGTAPSAPAQPAPAPAPEPALASAPAPEPAPSPSAVQLAMPKLEPVLLPETKAPAALGSRTFQYPVHDIYRLNYCLNRDKDCGEPAAQAWCTTQGFRRASGFKIDENIGALFPTVVLGEDRVCAKFVCDGFREITCAN